MAVLLLKDLITFRSGAGSRKYHFLQAAVAACLALSTSALTSAVASGAIVSQMPPHVRVAEAILWAVSVMRPLHILK